MQEIPLSSKTPQTFLENLTHLSTEILKQPSQAISCSKYSFQVVSYTKISVFSTKSNMTVTVFKELPKAAAVHTCSVKKLF